MPVFKKVLFIDDDFITVNICSRLMKLVDFAGEFIPCEDGKQAKDYLSKNAHALPDIIFVDLNMTVMNGWEFLLWFSGWSTRQNINISVYVLSSSLYKEDYEQLDNCKIEGFIIKPITAENLNEISARHSA
jgi:two-component SAPR family response regulator